MPTNAAVLSQLMIAQERPLKRFISRLVDRESLEDILQSLWIRVQKVQDDPPIEDNKAFLFYLARNVAFDEGRAEARRKRLRAEIETIVGDGGSADYVMPLDEAAIARDDLNRVLARAQALPEPTKTIFYLNRMEHVPIREIAVRLGVSRTTVEKHLRRALVALGEALAGS